MLLFLNRIHFSYCLCTTAADNPGNRLKRQAIDAVKEFFREPNLQVQSTARWLEWCQEHYPDGRPFGEPED